MILEQDHCRARCVEPANLARGLVASLPRWEHQDLAPSMNPERLLLPDLPGPGRHFDPTAGDMAQECGIFHVQFEGYFRSFAGPLVFSSLVGILQLARTRWGLN